MNDSGYTPVGIRVYRTGDNAMKYTLSPKGEDPIEVSAVRLSIPNFENSCLSVEKKGKRFYGNWVGTEGSKLKKLNVSKNRLTIDGEARKVSIAEVRVGRMGITENGKPIAFLTDAGGDYAVLQWFKPGVTVEQMQDPEKEILDFASEEYADERISSPAVRVSYQLNSNWELDMFAQQFQPSNEPPITASGNDNGVSMAGRISNIARQ